MKLLTLSRILGRQGLIKNYNLSKIKNNLREEDEFTGSCVITNEDRYYGLDERSNLILSNRKRYREIKF